MPRIHHLRGTRFRCGCRCPLYGLRVSTMDCSRKLSCRRQMCPTESSAGRRRRSGCDDTLLHKPRHFAHSVMSEHPSNGKMSHGEPSTKHCTLYTTNHTETVVVNWPISIFTCSKQTLHGQSQNIDSWFLSRGCNCQPKISTCNLELETGVAVLLQRNVKTVFSFVSDVTTRLSSFDRHLLSFE
jgi:hypothetical protein